MNKYSWSFSEDEIWYNPAGTIEECIKQAKEEREDESIVYIGENVLFEPIVNESSVLEDIMDQAYEECGDVALDWDAYDCQKQSELDELSKELTEVVNRWLDKYGYATNFYSVKNIKEYKLEEGEQNE